MKTINLMIISFMIFIAGLMNPALATGKTLAVADTMSGEIVEEEMAMEDSTSFDELPAFDQEKQVVRRGDTTYISFGNKKIQIIEKNGQTDVKIKDKLTGEDDFTFESDDENEYEYDYNDEGDDKDHKSHSGKDFKGHWAGFEFGLNNYMDADYSLTRSDASEFMDINTGRSWNFNWNILQYSLGFGTDHIGLVTGLGFEWNNYHFKDTTSIYEVDGDVAPYVFTEGEEWESIKKNRLQTTYLTVPLILEAQFLGKNRNKRVHMGVGLITGIKIGSNAKMVYTEQGITQRIKNKQDFYLSPVRFGLTARLGYRALKLYANYYLTPMFLEDHGPEQLNPVAAGLVFSF